MANKIQLRRDTADNWTRVNPILDDGEPGLNIDNNQIKYGDGNTAWNDLNYASGGGLPESDGVVTFPGNFLIGTLWPNDPYTPPSFGDKESVVWAKDDTEYLGLWWGGDMIYPESNYGPIAGIMIGQNAGTDDFSSNASPEGAAVVIGVNDSTGNTNEWTFDRDGSTTFPNGSKLNNANPNQFATDNSATQSLDIRDITGAGFYTDTPGFVLRSNSSKNWVFGTDGNLTLPTGGEIHSTAGTGHVTIQSSDGSNPRNFVFNTSGSISFPHLTNQGNGSIDANDNLLALTSGDTVDFTSFSGMILVNCHNSGNVTLYLCGGGTGDAVALGSSKGSSLGSLAFNSGIAGYTFTASETGNYVFCAIRTRTGG